jgi:hypothetical protein
MINRLIKAHARFTNVYGDVIMAYVPLTTAFVGGGYGFGYAVSNGEHAMHTAIGAVGGGVIGAVGGAVFMIPPAATLGIGAYAGYRYRIYQDKSD